MSHKTPDPRRVSGSGSLSSPRDVRSDRLSLLADVATRLLMRERPEAIAADVYALLAAHLDLDVFFNYVVEDDGSGMRLAACEGVPESVRAAIGHLDIGQSACGTVALRRAPIVAEDLQRSSDPVVGMLRDLGIRAYACHPLLAHDELLGTLAFASRTRDRFTPQELRLMATTANQAALAMERDRLMQAHKREQDARRNAESSLVTALQDSEARLRTVLDILPVGVFIADGHGRIVLVNRAAGRIWGALPLAERPADYERYEGRWAATGQRVAAGEWGLPRAIGGEESLDREIEILAFDGERRTILNSALPIRDAANRIVGGVAVDVDITERKRAEDALKRSEATLAQAGKMASLGAWRIEFAGSGDPNDNPLHWSDQVYRIFGYEPGHVAVTNDLFFEHVHPHDRQRVRDAVDRAIAERGPYAIEHRIVRRDGVERVVFEHADIVFNEHGDLTEIIGAVQDITDLKRAEEVLREADRRKNEFLATLSHELRNPLAAIRYALELIGGSPESPDEACESGAGPDALTRRSREVIDRQLRHLVRLVDDLLDVTRIESNKVTLRKSRVELRGVLRQAVEAADPEIRDGNHELRIDVPLEPVWVDADPDRLSQVVTNLLNNAARYTAAGGLITLSARVSRHELVITVADNGVGLAPEDLSRVFQLFAQVGDRPGAGLGIGLALVKGMVEMHGGSVEARSDGIGMGAEFTVRLPRAEAQAAVVEDQRHAVTAGPRSPGRRVLIVEDNTDAAEMIAALLQIRGHEVRVAADGRSALAAARACRPEVGLFDIGLPDMSGYDLARQVRGDADLREMYLVAITGWGQDEDRTTARDAGFDLHLTKPADPEAVERAVAQAPRVSPPPASSASAMPPQSS